MACFFQEEQKRTTEDGTPVYGCPIYFECTSLPHEECAKTCKGCPFKKDPLTYIEKVEAAISAAESKAFISEDILSIDGMSSRKMRTFLVYLGAKRYLEVGSWKGSTFVSACQSSNLEIAVACDSFSQFDGEKARPEFYKNCKELIGDKNWKMVEGNFYDRPYMSFPENIDVFFYDAQHSEEATRRGMYVGWPHMDDVAILIIDDTNFHGVLSGARKGLEDVGAIIHKEWHLPANGNGDKEQWWNGVYVAVVSKPKGPRVSAICCTFDFPRRTIVLEEAIESFYRQTWPNKELLIVNDSPSVELSLPSSVKGLPPYGIPPYSNVRIISAKERFPSLGDKYNAGCEAATGDILMSWDDDDISLSHRMLKAVHYIQQKKVDYYNPKAYFFMNGNDIKMEYRTGYAHNASAYTKEAWMKCGGYPSVNGPQDALFDAKLQKEHSTYLGENIPADYAYVYRWGDGQLHISGNTNTDEAYKVYGGSSKPGKYQLSPKWRMDYEGWCTSKRTEAENEATVAATPPMYRAPESRGPVEMSICIPTRNDYQGLWATLNAIRMYHREILDRVEFVVVDNSDGREKESHGPSNKHITTIANRSKYIPYTSRTGTASTKQKAIEEAEGTSVLLIDCHVMFPSGVLARLIDFHKELREGKHKNQDLSYLDLFHGPCLGDQICSIDEGVEEDKTSPRYYLVGTEFRPTWGTLMHGQWHVNDEKFLKGHPFKIWGSGCGMVSFDRASWLSFSEHTKGFGGEEGYIHQKYRNAGRNVWCLPWALWSHRFGNVTRTNYPTSDRCWNYFVSHYEVGSPSIEEIRTNFARHVTKDKMDLLEQEACRVVRESLKKDKNSVSVPLMARDAGLQDWEPAMLEKWGCSHRGERLGTAMCNIGCQGMQSQPVSIFECALYGQVTLSKRRQELTMCAGCSHAE